MGKPAARLMDIGSNHGAWPPTPIIAGSTDVLVNGRPAARQGDPLIIHAAPKNPPHPRAIKGGSSTVTVNGKPMARVGDAVDCGGTIISGGGDVLVGDSPPPARSAIGKPEWDEVMARSFALGPQSPAQELKMRADIAVKYRGAAGAAAVWQQHYRGQLEAGEPVPEAQSVDDAHEKAGLEQARREHRLAAAETAMDAALQGEAKSLDDVVARLAAVREYLEAGGKPRPKYTDDQLLALAAEGISGRFLISLQPQKDENEAIGFTRPDTQRTTMWSTTAEQAEWGDTDPELQADIQGMAYDPSQQYSFYILDLGPDYKTDGPFAISPTFENMRKVGVREFGRLFEQDLLKEVMTPEYQTVYASVMDELRRENLNEFNKYDVEKFSRAHFETQRNRDLFFARHLYRTQIGCNRDFLGTGVTKWQSGEQRFGTVELLTVERKPTTIAELRDDGRLKIVPAAPLRKA